MTPGKQLLRSVAMTTTCGCCGSFRFSRWGSFSEGCCLRTSRGREEQQPLVCRLLLGPTSLTLSHSETHESVESSPMKLRLADYVALVVCLEQTHNSPHESFAQLTLKSLLTRAALLRRRRRGRNWGRLGQGQCLVAMILGRLRVGLELEGLAVGLQ